MSIIKDEVLAANAIYSERYGEKSKLQMPPKRKFAILTCMDARLDPAKFSGLSEGDAHVIRNAGGRATDDAIRSLVISYKLLGTKEWFVVHHTNCGMETFSDSIMSKLLANSLETSRYENNAWHDSNVNSGSSEAKYINWHTISNQNSSIIDDVSRIRNHSLVPDYIPIYGYLFDVKSGLLEEIREASHIGQSR